MKCHLTAFICIILVLPCLAQEHHSHFNQSQTESSNNIFLAIMDSMMVNMIKAPKGKTIDEDFLLQMIPHHLAAIEMARHEINNGNNFEMVQLAKSILTEQQIEVQQMFSWIKQLKTVDKNFIPQYAEVINQTMLKMMKGLPETQTLLDIDHAFASTMLPHHQAAIDMTRVILKYGEDLQIKAFAKMLISSEQLEIQQMSIYLKKR